jgi:adenylyltransferase/sulfurtransferase
MGLTDQQIERYARQIIVPGIGGIAQERLLGSRLMLSGNRADVGLVLPYFAGAGIGQIRLLLPDGDSGGYDALIARVQSLNSDVSVSNAADDSNERFDLVFAIGDDRLAAASMLSPVLLPSKVPTIIVSLAEPASVALFTTSPPCPICADLKPTTTGPRSDYAGFVAMIAAAEGFKLLARSLPISPAGLLQFNRFECAMTPLRQTPRSIPCACEGEQ